MNNVFNSKLQQWLDDENRTIEDGCMLLLQMENNQIHYRNLLQHPNKAAVMKYLLSEIKKRLNVRLKNITHEEVAKMDEQVQDIVKKRFAFRDTTKEGTTDEEFRRGKRADHDELPDEIQALYVENLDILRRMREVHLKLRSISSSQVSCPDNERYPFLKELIALDKKYHENWDTYDHYVAGETSVKVAADSSTSDESDDEQMPDKGDTSDHAKQGQEGDGSNAEGAAAEGAADEGEKTEAPADSAATKKKTTTRTKTAKATKSTKAK